MMASKPGRPDVVLVAAIDLGTSYSGYAYQFAADYKDNPVKILAPQSWNSGKHNLVSPKTPTCLLLNDKQELDECAFGFEAENRYASLCSEQEQDKYYFFRRFKMQLQEGEGLTKSSLLDDITGKKMLALKVFALSIFCLKSHLMKELQKKNICLKEDDILWVLTVPAIWDEAAKQFMREAAITAGIDSEKLEIALEPEAASIFCQHNPLSGLGRRKDQIKSDVAPTRIRYMVVDLGGGTADITVHDELGGGKLKEVMKPSGGPWGGITVDSAFFQLLVSIVGAPVMNRFIKEETFDYFYLSREFEAAKRNFNRSNKDKMIIKIPASLNKLCEDANGRGFTTCLAESVHSQDISLKQDRMMINPSKVEVLFRAATDSIVQHVKGILEKDRGKHISVILMVGGFSESQYVQEVICEAFERKNELQVIIPQDPGICIVKGAVLFGRKPHSIESRVLRFTYGEMIWEPFVEGKHPVEKKEVTASGIYCKEVFFSIISADSEVNNDYSITQSFSTWYDLQENVLLEVYYTKEKSPQFVTDPGCKLLVKSMVRIPNPSIGKRYVDVTYQFGLTHLRIIAVERETKAYQIMSFEMDEDNNFQCNSYESQNQVLKSHVNDV